MEQARARFDFSSDNTAGFCPEVLHALADVNPGTVASYGQDELTGKLRDRVQEIFETDCEAFLVFNGTAANALALAQLCQSYHGIFCHRNAHIQTDECGAPELFTGGAKLILLGGANGLIEPAEFVAGVSRYRDFHSHKPRVLSLTQSTEFGAAYSPERIRDLTDAAGRMGMLTYLDGARFANAVATLGLSPKEASWKLGVEAMSFGGIKNGGGNAELVIFFNKEHARDFDYRVKQAGQLSSKTRFLAATWLALLADDVWLKNARHANHSARLLAEELRQATQLEPVYPVEANAVFISLSAEVYDRMTQAGWRFYNFFEPDVYRLMCSWATSEKVIGEFVSDLQKNLRS